MRITAFSVSGAGASGAKRSNIGIWCDSRCTASSGSIVCTMQAVPNTCGKAVSLFSAGSICCLSFVAWVTKGMTISMVCVSTAACAL